MKTFRSLLLIASFLFTISLSNVLNGQELLTIEGNGYFQGFMPKIELAATLPLTGSFAQIKSRLRAAGDSTYLESLRGDLHFGTSGIGNPNIRMTIKETGAVGIGISSNLPDGYLLAVDGNIIAEEFFEELSQNWPDYVFDEDYRLMSIDELAHSIKLNGHLPGILSANEVEMNGGHSLGSMQIQLLKKVEELTLYIIELNKQNKMLEEKIEAIIK